MSSNFTCYIRCSRTGFSFIGWVVVSCKTIKITPVINLYLIGWGFKVLGAFQTCSPRTTLISFALGPAASNAWQEMSQCDGGRSLAFLVGFVPLSLNESGSQADDSLYRLICLNRKWSCFCCFSNLFENSLLCAVYSWYQPSFVSFWWENKIWKDNLETAWPRLISLSKASVTTIVSEGGRRTKCHWYEWAIK